jgi:hypothetical protein
LRRIIKARPGVIGFDINERLDKAKADAFFAHGYTFAVRYVRRNDRHDYDLSESEVSTILQSGLGLMVVQHVKSEPWRPGLNLGALYGQNAARECKAIGLPPGTMVWCDLEGVALDTKPVSVIEHCNAWFDAVASDGYLPGLYVGFNPGLNASQLYKDLRFSHFWAAYNLNRDQFPLTRGVQMVQRAATAEDRIEGIQQDGFDVDIVVEDHLKGLPQLLVGDR